jgi:hypothetical protein
MWCLLTLGEALECCFSMTKFLTAEKYRLPCHWCSESAALHLSMFAYWACFGVQDDTTFEKQSSLFALAVADVLLINMWCHDIGREHAANKPLLKIVFQASATDFCILEKLPGLLEKHDFKHLLPFQEARRRRWQADCCIFQGRRLFWGESLLLLLSLSGREVSNQTSSS